MKIKNILLLIVVATISLISADSPYLGASISASNADDALVSCRAATSLIAGIKFSDSDFTFSGEGRSMNSFNGSYTSNSFYLKPEYKGVYALVGYGRTKYTEHNIEHSGPRYGIGYDFGLKAKHIFVDIIYDKDADEYIFSAGALYFFEGI